MFDEDDIRIRASGQGPPRRIVVDPDGALAGNVLHLRARLGQLGEERLAAREAGLMRDVAYAEDLEAELAGALFAHEAAIVLRLALLRADFEGRHYG